MNCLAIIPARSGSKGLTNKNIKILDGKPLMAYSIEAALESGIFKCVHVSTDSEAYAKIAEQYGANVPFLRSREKSSDLASTWDAVKEVLSKYRAIGHEFDTVTLLQPTSPLRTVEDIRKAHDLFKKKKAKAVVSVCETDHSPLWCNTLNDDLSMDMFIEDKDVVSRQKLKTYYRINGAIYIVDINFLMENNNIYRKGCFAYIMGRESSIDIDTQFDYDMASYLINRRSGGVYLKNLINPIAIGAERWCA